MRKNEGKASGVRKKGEMIGKTGGKMGENEGKATGGGGELPEKHGGNRGKRDRGRKRKKLPEK